MRIKNLLLSVLSCIVLACATNVALADDCDDLIIHVHNNTAAPIFLVYDTTYTSPAITESRFVPAGQTINLQRMVNLGQQDTILATLRLMSVRVPGQPNYAYALSTVQIAKVHVEGGSFGQIKGAIITDDVSLPHADLGFGIDFPQKKINNGYCSTPAAAKPGQITVEVYHPALKAIVNNNI